MTDVKGPDRRDKGVRCHLFYGPDEAGSRARAARVIVALGPEAERVDLTGSLLRSDPALLADEAASSSLFGGQRYIRIDPAGDECVSAIEALLASANAIHPVILIAGAIKKDSRLVKLVDGHPAGSASASYIPDSDELARIALSAAAEHGVRLSGDLARSLVAIAASDRAVLAAEIEKLANYLDADPDRPIPATAADIDAIGALLPDADTSLVVSALASGNIRGLDNALHHLGSDGQDAIMVVRATLRRLLAMAAIRAEMSRGATAKAAIDRAGRALFWKEKEAVASDVQRWSTAKLDAAIDRVAALERLLKSTGGPGSIAVDHLLHGIARSVKR